jgi:hypothetical protein
MEKLFLLAHAAGIYKSDFFPCGTHVLNPACSACDGNLNGLAEPLMYYWDFEFEDPQKSIDADHHCYWGGWLLMVNSGGRTILEGADLPIDFRSTELSEGDLPDGLDHDSYKFFWASTTCEAVADPIASDNEVCTECGEFKKRRNQITRLRIPKSNIPACGIFTVRQNGAHGPTFVTERTKEKLINSGLRGLAFYSAGSRAV